MIARKYITGAILFLPLAIKCQHITQHTNMLWAGYYNTTRFNEKWSLASDAQIRTKDWTNKWSQILVRSGAGYTINNRVSVTVGMAFFKNAQYVGKELLMKNEWRPWQEVAYQLPLHKINFIQRLRTEERFMQLVKNNELSRDYQYIFRSRYKFEFQFPLKASKLMLLAGNEIMVNPHYIQSSLFFDQNRTSVGINFKMNSKSALQCQYVKIFQWRSTTSVMDDQNVFRVNFIHQINCSKKV
ncbi:MAG TPA: DUF2490 domain-containing protein [Hanamia sp.]